MKKNLAAILFLVTLFAAAGCKKVDTTGDYVIVDSVTLDVGTTATVIVGETLQLTAIVKPSNATNQTVTWSSSSPGVASVDETGLVTAHTLGKTDITATCKGGKNATCEVEVLEVPIPVTDLVIQPDEVSVSVGGTVKLQLIFTPANATNRKVKWFITTGQDKEVASISTDHVVTGKKKGDVTFWARSEDNEEACGWVNVHVVEPFSSVKIDVPNLPEGSALDVDQTCQLTATATPADCGDKVVWEISSGSSYATITPEGLLKGVREGQVTVRAYAMANPTVLDTRQIRVYSKVTGMQIIPVGMSGLTKRPTEYIGAGQTQRWKPLFLPSTAYQNKSVSISDRDSGNGFNYSSFSTENNILTVTAPSNRVSSKGGTMYSGSVTLCCSSGNDYVYQEFPFTITEFDPFQPKLGDLVYYDNVNKKVLTFDYGYRGRGIKENPISSTLPDWTEKFGSVVKRYRIGIVGYTGSEHLTEDPCLVATNYSLPGIDGKHGIIIPYDKIFASRTSSPWGWQVPSDGKEQFCSEEDNLSTRQGPGIAGIDMTRLRENASYKSKHYAFHNTAALLWYNMSRGDSHMVRPEIYFASSEIYTLLGSPSGDYNTRYKTMHSYDLGSNPSGTSWLFPGFADMSSVFSGQSVAMSATAATLDERLGIIEGAIRKFSGNTVDFSSGITYWVHHDITDKMASLYIIKYEGGDYKVLTGSTYKNYVNYVIPISYF